MLPKINDRIKFIDKNALKTPIRKVLTVDNWCECANVRYKKRNYCVYFYEIIEIYNSKI